MGQKYIKKAVFRHNIPTFKVRNFGTYIGTEELGHLEMVGTLVHQLTRNLSEDQIRTAGFDAYFVDHTTGIYPQFASGYPWSASTMQVTGDIIADLTEDLAAEQKARLTYDNILRLSDDPDVSNVIRFLREREIVHFQRFGEANHTDLSRFIPCGLRLTGDISLLFIRAFRRRPALLHSTPGYNPEAGNKNQYCSWRSRHLSMRCIPPLNGQ